jgi:polyisoprenoid-binding protein YceI
MKNSVILIGLGLVLVLCLAVVAGGLVLYNFVLGPTLSASGDLTAIPVVVNTQAAAAATAAPRATAEPAATTAGEPTAASAPTEAAGEAPASGHLIFALEASGSEVRFYIDEVLRGQPKTVEGVTNQIAGELAVDPADLSTAQVGIIQINARTFATDSGQRDRAIRNFILQTDQYEFITFTPTAITGLSGSAAPGDTFAFEVTGDLTIRDITQPVVFTVTATAVSPTQLSGSASTTVNRSDFALTIPNVPQVADVSEAVILEFEFTASAT